MIRCYHHNLEFEIAFWLHGIMKDTHAAHSKQLTIADKNLDTIDTFTAQEILEWVETAPKPVVKPKIQGLNAVPSTFMRQSNP